ncbi:MAG TPA: ABC transporter substrate-binding protein [Pirellulales bacterium]|nr:ABC transporter substrate-binding protein [Pirellulales bacterium]
MMAMRVLVCLVVGIGLGGCGQKAKDAVPPPEDAAAGGHIKIRLALNWYPEAEHGGYYAALLQGYYRQEGLEVQIIKGGPKAPVIPQVDNGQFEFGIYNADGLITARSKDADVVAVFAPLQISPRAIMVHAASGIDDFSQLNNVTLATDHSQAYFAFLKQKVPLGGVKVVPYQGSVASFLADPKFAQQAYVFSEPFVAEQEGGDPKSLLVAELGFNPYTSVLITSDQYLAEHADVVQAMVSASRRGWEHYLEHPDETNRHIHELNPEMSLAALEYGVNALRPLVLDDVAKTEGIGHMTPQRWRTLAEQLEELGIAEPVDVSKVFTTRFLEQRPE